jgi:hypothetical protein
MKNAFSLYTFLPSVFGVLCLGCTESHVKNITFPKKYIFNLPPLLFYVLEKSLIFSVHLYTFCPQPLMALGAIGVQRAFFLCTPLYTALIN